MTMKTVEHWARPALILGLSLLGSLSSHAFCNPEARSDRAAIPHVRDGKAVLQCRYGPSGEVIRATGHMPKANPFRSRTKHHNDQADLVYYGYRYYNASTGRWLNRDPLSAASGTEARSQLLVSSGQDPRSAEDLSTHFQQAPTYVISHNNSVGSYDLLGLCEPLPDEGQGQLDKAPIHWIWRDTTASTLSWTVCCPVTAPALVTYGITADPPPWTPSRHPFPEGWGTIYAGLQEGSEHCYSIVIAVPSRTAFWHTADVARVRVTGTCCCTATFGPARSDPRPNPTPPDRPSTSWPPTELFR